MGGGAERVCGREMVVVGEDKYSSSSDVEEGVKGE